MVTMMKAVKMIKMMVMISSVVGNRRWRMGRVLAAAKLSETWSNLFRNPYLSVLGLLKKQSSYPLKKSGIEKGACQILKIGAHRILTTIIANRFATYLKTKLFLLHFLSSCCRVLLNRMWMHLGQDVISGEEGPSKVILANWGSVIGFQGIFKFF